MALSRRRLLVLVTGSPALAALAPVASAWARASTAIAPAVRPLPGGRSDERCAVCGSAGHTMLDPACPSRPTLPRRPAD